MMMMMIMMMVMMININNNIIMIVEKLKEVSMTWTGCETIEDLHSDYYGSPTGLLLVLSVSDRHLPYTVHMDIRCVPRIRRSGHLEAHMFSPHLGTGLM